MKFPHRRQFLHLAAGAAALPAASRMARAEAYPTKPVRAFIPFAAGSATDLSVHRTVFEPLAIELGQPIVIENRGGAGGTIAGSAVAQSPTAKPFWRPVPLSR
jgi:tripartite-type tricarboxylate transporter receptor subunit TctC